MSANMSVCLTMLPNESPCASIVSTLHMENFQVLFPSGYLSFSAFKASAGPHCVLVVNPGSGMITADYYTRSTALTARPTQ